MFRLSLFGPFSLTDSNCAEVPLASKKAKALLAYLAQTPGKPRSREEILALLWSDRKEVQGRASLRQVLTGLRKTVGENLLRIDRESVALDPGFIEVAPSDGGEFLSGFHLSDPAFEEWLRDERSAAENANSESAVTSAAGQVEMPRIAVLPFANLSRDPEQEYFSDGITEDIITELNRFHSLFVFASSSSFTLRGQEAEPIGAGQKLGAQFLVQGSIRTAGDRMRISAQLVDATTAGQLWSERYDRDLTDIFSVQDEIAATVATMISGHVDIASRVKSERKHPRDINAYDLVCRSDWYGYTDFGAAEVLGFLEQAIALDPNYAEAHAKLAVHQAYLTFLEALPLDEIIASVKKHGAVAAQLAPGDAMVHAPLAEAYAFLGEHDLAAHHLNRSLSINPNAYRVMMHSAEAAACLGHHRLGVELVEKARLRDPFSSLSYRESVFDVYFLAGRYNDALEQFFGWPDPPLHMDMSKAAALAQLGRIQEAQDVVRDLEARRSEGWSVKEVARSYLRMCAMPEDRKRWREGFQMAGLET